MENGGFRRLATSGLQKPSEGESSLLPRKSTRGEDRAGLDERRTNRPGLKREGLDVRTEKRENPSDHQESPGITNGEDEDSSVPVLVPVLVPQKVPRIHWKDTRQLDQIR